ncbi:MAG: hypothetical protein WCQ45_02680, partial [bacterium]
HRLKRRSLRRSRRAASAFVVLVVLLTSATGVGASASQVRAESKHFVITYETGTSFDYVQLVQRGLEAAYNLFVVRSAFATFPTAALVIILGEGTGSMGAEYLEPDDAGNPFPVIEIASEASMQAAANTSSTGLSLTQAVLSTTAHEFFHVLQDYASLNGVGDISEPAFIEPLATAVQEIAAPNANDYINAAADFLLAPDAMSFFDRGYDGGLFWVFVLDRYGGLDAVRRVMKASATYDGSQAIDHAFAAEGFTLLDLWAKFAIALVTNTLPDADVLAKLLASWRSELDLPDLHLPPAVAVADWTGASTVIDRVTEASPAAALLGTSGNALGTQFPGAELLGAELRVAYPYGIDVVSMRPRSASPLAISITADAATDFRIAVAGRRGGAWDLLSPSGRDVVVRSPQRYEEIRVILTRGESSTGSYTVHLAGVRS